VAAAKAKIQLHSGDALIVVDVQNDFLPGGSLAVPDGDAVVPVLNRYIAHFSGSGLPIYASRDWHPSDHCSFESQGGIWPVHCVAESAGASLAPDLELPDEAVIVDKATSRERDAYSAFESTTLEDEIRRNRCDRLFIGGLATDYCVLNTVRDAAALGFQILVMRDAIRAVDVREGDGARAEAEMKQLGARMVTLDDIDGETSQI
jgi:nicotinamidase/pyrazinamidase